MSFDESFEEENFFLDDRRKFSDFRVDVGEDDDESGTEEKQNPGNVTQTSSFDDDCFVLQTETNRQE